MADNKVTANPGAGGPSFAVDFDGAGTAWPYSKLVYGAGGTQTEVSQANPLPVETPAFTPAQGAATSITTGGTAVTAVTGPINGGYIVNAPDATAQGISVAENLYVDMVNQPGSTDAGANGTCQMLAPGDKFTLPRLASGVPVRVNAATSGHKFTCVVW